MAKGADALIDEPLTPEQLAEIPHPLLTLTQHCAIKGIEAGTPHHHTILPPPVPDLSMPAVRPAPTSSHHCPPVPFPHPVSGSLFGNAVGAALLLVNRPPSAAVALQSAGRYGWRFAAAGAAVSVGLMGAKLWQEDFNAYRIWDRSYRLNHSASQRRCDQFSWMGGLIGALVMQHPVLRMGTPIQAALAGASIGVADGVLLHAISNPKEEVVVAAKKSVKAVEDNVKEVAGVQPHHPPRTPQ